jgi:hypothetical protein
MRYFLSCSSVPIHCLCQATVIKSALRSWNSHFEAEMAKQFTNRMTHQTQSKLTVGLFKGSPQCHIRISRFSRPPQILLPLPFTTLHLTGHGPGQGFPFVFQHPMFRVPKVAGTRQAVAHHHHLCSSVEVLTPLSPGETIGTWGPHNHNLPRWW